MNSLDLLQNFDAGTLDVDIDDIKTIDLDVAYAIVDEVKNHMSTSSFIGVERMSGSLVSILSGLQQDIDIGGISGPRTYAAKLLWRIVRNHPFLDGNKRSGALLFKRALEDNGFRLSDTEVSLCAVLVASWTGSDDEILKFIINLEFGKVG